MSTFAQVGLGYVRPWLIISKRNGHLLRLGLVTFRVALRGAGWFLSCVFGIAAEIYEAGSPCPSYSVFTGAIC